ncbi:MAG TPA: hypothetical protein VFW50_34760 [Streptosporangiaceae bacterium]|nr:hypothetical protein [Streptosporangiaceae bacterium]
MTAYLIRRAGISLVILGPKASPQAVAACNAQNGYDGPVIVQYWHYLDELLHGNLGYSTS